MEINHSGNNLEPNAPTIKILSIEFGPEFTVSGNSVHVVVLNNILRDLPRDSYGEKVGNIHFCLKVSGKFSPNLYAKPIVDGVRSCRFDREGLVWINTGISQETVSCQQSEFREKFKGIIRECVRSLIRYMDRKKISFESELFRSHIELALERYDLLELPLSELPEDRAIKLYVSGELDLPSEEYRLRSHRPSPIG